MGISIISIISGGYFGSTQKPDQPKNPVGELSLWEKVFMYSTAFVKMFLPGWLLEHFEVTKFEDRDNQIDIYLDEIKEVPGFLRDHKVISHGFTQAVCIQDFPVRGKAVFLHLRRRKWLDTSDGSIHSNTFDLTHKGTQLTKELVAFFKATNRE